MAAHLYWRVHITAAGGSVAAIAEMEMYDAAGALLTTGGTASASSFYAPEGLVAANAFNGNFGDWWASNGVPSTGSPEWLRYQFASAVDVAVVRIMPRPLSSQYPNTFSIQYSDDGSAWTTAAGPVSPAWGSVTLKAWSFGIGAAAGSYANWRLYVTAVVGVAQGASCGELEFHETAGGADITNATVSRYSFASQEYLSSFVAVQAFDNNLTTIWGSTDPPPQFIGQALNRTVQIAEIKWTSRNDSFNQNPTSMKIQGSNDGATWTDVAVLTPAAWTTNGQSQTLPVTAAGTLLAHPGMTGGMREMTGGLRG
jgi:hypothetical protein